MAEVTEIFRVEFYRNKYQHDDTTRCAVDGRTYLNKDAALAAAQEALAAQKDAHGSDTAYVVLGRNNRPLTFGF